MYIDIPGQKDPYHGNGQKYSLLEEPHEHVEYHVQTRGTFAKSGSALENSGLIGPFKTRKEAEEWCLETGRTSNICRAWVVERKAIVYDKKDLIYPPKKEK